jgi:hypothetical protein
MKLAGALGVEMDAFAEAALANATRGRGRPKKAAPEKKPAAKGKRKKGGA